MRRKPAKSVSVRPPSSTIPSSVLSLPLVFIRSAIRPDLPSFGPPFSSSPVLKKSVTEGTYKVDVSRSDKDEVLRVTNGVSGRARMEEDEGGREVGRKNGRIARRERVHDWC